MYRYFYLFIYIIVPVSIALDFFPTPVTLSSVLYHISFLLHVFVFILFLTY